MSVLMPDAVIRVRFLTPEEGGRKSSIEGERYGCPIMVGEQGFDGRFVLEAGRCLEPGRTYDIKVAFLDPESALSVLQEETLISLWEGRTIAEGKILRLLP